VGVCDVQRQRNGRAARPEAHQVKGRGRETFLLGTCDETGEVR
jgi:hypothetical protein